MTFAHGLARKIRCFKLIVSYALLSLYPWSRGLLLDLISEIMDFFKYWKRFDCCRPSLSSKPTITPLIEHRWTADGLSDSSSQTGEIGSGKFNAFSISTASHFHFFRCLFFLFFCVFFFPPLSLLPIVSAAGSRSSCRCVSARGMKSETCFFSFSLHSLQKKGPRSWYCVMGWCLCAPTQWEQDQTNTKPSLPLTCAHQRDSLF